MHRRSFLAGTTATAGTALFGSTVGAQAVPSRTVRVIVPFGPGGPTDVVARILADAMAPVWSVPVIVENKPGAGTLIGTQEVARSEPDGHVIGIVISAHGINPAVRRKMPFDTVKDLRGLTQLAEAHMVLVAHPSFPADTVPDLVKLARAQPDPIAYATPGPATAVHMAAELLQRVAEMKLLHVPYSGSAKALTDVLSNRVPLLFDVWHSVQPLVADKSLKVLGVINATRIPNAPQYPMIGETYPGYQATSIFGIVVAGATPDAVVEKLSSDLRAYIRSDAFKARAASLGMTPVGSSPAEFDATVRSEISKWRDIASAANIAID